MCCGHTHKKQNLPLHNWTNQILIYWNNQNNKPLSSQLWYILEPHNSIYAVQSLQAFDKKTVKSAFF